MIRGHVLLRGAVLLRGLILLRGPILLRKLVLHFDEKEAAGGRCRAGRRAPL